uniref:Uncharacterized protein n=1 Tax=Neolamprologus brichardi TaxID=32507 RepID=A0A3Q4G959_NEOBR
KESATFVVIWRYINRIELNQKMVRELRCFTAVEGHFQLLQSTHVQKLRLIPCCGVLCLSPNYDLGLIHGLTILLHFPSYQLVAVGVCPSLILQRGPFLLKGSSSLPQLTSGSGVCV